MGYHEGWALINAKTERILFLEDNSYAIYTSEQSAVVKAAEFMNKTSATISIRRVKIPLPWFN